MTKEGLEKFNIESGENIIKDEESQEKKKWAGFETAEERVDRQFNEKEQEKQEKIERGNIKESIEARKEIENKHFNAGDAEKIVKSATVENTFKREDNEELRLKEPRLIRLSYLDESGKLKKEVIKKETEEAKLEIAEELLDKARSNYIAGRKKHSRGIPSISAPDDFKELEESEVEYINAKILYGKKLRRDNIPEAEIFKKIIIDENNALLKARNEFLPVKEKNIFRKGLDLWMRQGRGTRILISTALITGLSIATGGVAAAGIGSASLFAGSRFVKGFASAIMAQGIGKGVDWAFSKAFIEKVQKEAEGKEAEAAKELSEGELTLEKIKKIEANYQQVTERLAKLERTKTLTKGAAMIIAGVGTSIGLNWLENTYVGSLKPAASADMSPEKINKFKSYEDVSARHNVEALKNAAQTRAESILEDNHIEDLATIKSGEGAWNAVYRQLENQLDKNPAQFGLKAEDLDNATRFKFLTQETNKILVENGYIKPDGSEIRIARPGIKVFLESDNKIKPIDGEGKLVYEWARPKAETITTPQFDNSEIISEETGISQESKNVIDEFIKNHKPKPEFLVNEPVANNQATIRETADTMLETAPMSKIVENTEFDTKGVFQYTPKGEISDLTIAGRTPGLWYSKALLNDNWRTTIIDKGFSTDNIHTNIIENRAGEILKIKRILKTLEDIGMAKSQETDYLNMKIKSIIDSTEATYGDVFK